MTKQIAIHPAYRQLHALFGRLSTLGQAEAMLQWDMSVMMPIGGAESRAQQLATLTSLQHDMLTAPTVPDWLDAAEQEPLSVAERANLGEMRRLWLHASALPASLVEALSHAGSACEMVWRKARPASDFALVAESLATVVRLTREVAEIKSQALGVSRYDALLDQYEPGGRAAEIDRIFADLAAFLPGFLSDVLRRQGTPPDLPTGPFAIDRQKTLGLKMMETLGFEFDHGRLDVSLHPFCGGTAEDVRITTRYDEGSFMRSLMGVLHETGHALYERGLPSAWRGQPAGQARGMSIHESQSLLMEMQACRSREFLAFAAPIMRTIFEGHDAVWEAESLYRANIRVQPDFIRVDADEVTYPAHVILRYRLERQLIEGDLEVVDLPSAWNSGFQSLLGLTPPDDRRGCLQDIHWFDGAFGYFPTYTLGAMTAAQLFDAAKRAIPTIPDSIADGDFAPLLGWLRDHVHAQGSLLSTDALLQQATGRTLDVDIFKRHLRRRYLES